MSKNQFKLPFIFVALFVSLVGRSQSDSTATDNEMQFKFGAFYNSNLNYYGRTDSLRSSGFFPVAEWWFTKNFYINATPVFVNNPSSSFQYAGTVAIAGYQFHNENKLTGHLYVVKPFYKDNSQLVQSALKAQAAFTLTRLGKMVNITGGCDVKFSDKADIGVTGGLDHIFRIPFSNQSVFVINPSAYLYAGTQQFTNTYYTKRNFLIFPGAEQLVAENVKKFNVLSYEFSVPLIFTTGKFQVIVLPAYVIPQNLITVPGRPDLSERGKEMFYITAGAKIVL
jgi:hypothetical protein